MEWLSILSSLLLLLTSSYLMGKEIMILYQLHECIIMHVHIIYKARHEILGALYF